MRKRYVVLIVLLVVLLSLTYLLLFHHEKEEVQEQESEEKEEVKILTFKKNKKWRPDGIITKGEYKYGVKLQSFELYWFIEGEYIYFGIKGHTYGWVAIGFNPSDKMKDADIVFAWIKAGIVGIDDQYSTGETGPHTSDTELGGTFDIEDYGGQEAEGWTTIEFKRKLNTGDSYDYAIVPGEEVKVMWAIGLSDSSYMKHIKMGIITIKIKE